MSDEKREEFAKKLAADKELLKACNLMDYSLLLITLNKEKGGKGS
jgi:hypothetical protein